MVVATYPTILPRTGSCARLGLTVAEADAMRRVGNTLAAVTRAAARRGGALMVDMHVLGADHSACAGIPWTYGWSNGSLAPFHPTVLGAVATAKAISVAIDGVPEGRNQHQVFDDVDRLRRSAKASTQIASPIMAGEFGRVR